MPPTGFAVNLSVKVMQLVTKIEVVSHLCSAPFRHVKELLQHVVVAKVFDRDQTLKTGVHVTVKCIVL